MPIYLYVLLNSTPFQNRNIFLILNPIHELLDPFVFNNKYKFIQVNLKEFLGKNSARLINLMYIIRFTNIKTFKQLGFSLTKEKPEGLRPVLARNRLPGNLSQIRT